MKKTAVVLFLVFTAAVVSAYTGGMPLEIISKPVGIRSMAMGYTGVSNSDDASSLFWNPAYLDTLASGEVYISVETLFEGANFEHLSYVQPVSKYGAFGISVSMMNYGDYEILSSEGQEGGISSMRDIIISAGYGKNIIAGVQAGVLLKGLVRSIGGVTYAGVNADVAFFKSFGTLLDTGLSFRNVLPAGIKYSEDEETAPFMMRLGATVNLLDGNLKFTLEAEKNFSGVNPELFFGAEYGLFNLLYVRAGAGSLGADNELTAGAGIVYKNLVFDYAASMNSLILSHKFGLNYRFGTYGVFLKAEPAMFSPFGGNKRTYITAESNTKYEAFKWMMQIKGPDGKTVKEWVGAGSPDSQFVWDGLRSDGLPHKDGEYRAVMTVTDENDQQVKSHELVIKISTNDEYQIPVMGD